MGQLKTTEDTLSKTKKELTKTEATLKDTEFNLEKEKESKAKLDKEKKRVEADLKDNKEKLAQTEEDLKASKDPGLKKDRAIKELEEISELQGQLADAEAASGRGLKQEVRKLELRVLELESDCDSEGRKSLAVAKQARQAEKKNEELEGLLDAEKKAAAAAGADVAELQGMIRTLRLSLEEASLKNNALATKNAKALTELEESEARCAGAEIALQKARAKVKAASGLPSRARTPAGGD